MIQQASGPQLIYTKLNRPRISGELVERPRLYAMLDAQHPLAVVTAPAGYGKTTLISGWVEAGKLRCAWLSLDAHDNEPGAFVRYLVSALERLIPAAVNADIFTLNVGAPIAMAAVARQLADVLEQVPERFVLVLDDYHTMAEPAIHLFIAQLLRYPPPCMSLIIATRVDPPLPLAAMRAKNQLTEIRARDLRFTGEETAAYMTQELAYALDAETLTNLVDSTEGWIAGLHFAALLLRNQSGEAALAFVQRQRGLATDYLAAEVLAQQPPEVQSFLVKTSILQRLCPPLCDAVLGPTAAPSSRILEHLAQQDLFVVALDDAQQWFRYHNLLQRLLNRMLHETAGRGEIAALYAAASRWCNEHELVDEAVGYAIDGGDTPQAAALIAQHRHAAMNREDWLQLVRWLQRVPRAAVNADAQFLLLEAWVLHKQQRLAEMAERLDLADVLLNAGDDAAAHNGELQREIDALRSQQYFRSGDMLRAREAAQRALDSLPLALASARGIAWFYLGSSTYFLEGLQPALDALEPSWAEDRARRTMITSRVFLVRCFLYWMAADLSSLKATAEDLLHLAAQRGWQESILWAHYFRGCALYACNELEAAADDFSAVVDQRQLAAGYTYVFSACGLAAARLAQGDPQAATTAANTLQEYAQQTGDRTIQHSALMLQAYLAIRQGREEAAYAWIDHAGQGMDVLSVHSFFAPALVLADLLVQLRTPACTTEAEQWVNRLEALLSSVHNVRFLIDVLVLKALLCARRSQPAAALAALGQAITLAQRTGAIRVLLDASPELDPLLARLRVAEPQATFVASVRHARAHAYGESSTLHPAAHKPKPGFVQPRHPDLIELLTQRELEVLQLLALRLTNKEIAQALAISTGTVKQHTRSVFQKLHVENRRDAIVQARNMGFQFDATHLA